MAKKDKLIWRETKEIPDPEMNVNGIVESRWRELEVKAAAVVGAKAEMTNHRF